MKKRERREGQWHIRERERERERPTSWSVVPFVVPSWPASSRSDTWPGTGSVLDTGGQSPSEHTEPAPSVHPYDGLKVYKINVRACVIVVWLMPKNIIINIDCGLVFNIKHEQWSTNTIYLSVLKHLTLYFQTDLTVFEGKKRGRTLIKLQFYVSIHMVTLLQLLTL